MPLTDQEVMEVLRSNTPLGNAVRVFSNECGKLEQAGMQRKPSSPIEARRMQIESVQNIAKALGVTIEQRQP